MQFVLIAKDRPNSLELRLQVRPTHLDYLRSLGDALVLAGPMLDGDGKPCGSVLVYEAADRAAAEQIAAEDPYTKANLFQSAEVSAYRIVVKDGAMGA